MLKSAWTQEWERADTPAPLAMPLQPVLTELAQRRIARAAHRTGSGAQKLANYYVGQIVGTMNETKTSRQVVYDMIDEFIEVVSSLADRLHNWRSAPLEIGRLVSGLAVGPARSGSRPQQVPDAITQLGKAGSGPGAHPQHVASGHAQFVGQIGPALGGHR